MAKLLTDTLKTIEQYKSSNPHYTELLDILEDILILREEYQRKITDDAFPIDEKLIDKKISGGLPLVDFSAGNFDLTESKRYFMDLLKIAEKRFPEESQDIIKKIKDGTIDIEKLILSSVTLFEEDEEIDETEEYLLDVVDLFAEESLRPGLEKVAEKYGDLISKLGWAEGYCPICGKEPKIGEIKEEDGKRYLFCNQCGFEWHFRRIKCPFCGNEEQQSLAYFTVETDERYRVDVCNECKRYIKIVDFRKTKEQANLDVEDIATLHLDMLANEEGYD
ncbi:MAG: formate dehydrogenase accessory protein FdhE [Deltaproteobacteria bacterium]|nr:formate dehydrogenase accessory protein FdhE [Deltaproteobacteria bacterium]